MCTRRKAAAPGRPLSLKAEAQARAVETYNRRVAELEALAPLLAHLEELRPALQADHGCTIYPDNITLSRESLSGGYGDPRHKVLRLQTSGWFDKTKPLRFITALQALGLKIVSTTPGPYGSALLRKGPLLMRVDLADPDTTALPAVLHAPAGQVSAVALANPHATVVCTQRADGTPLPGGYAMAPALAPAPATAAP